MQFLFISACIILGFSLFCIIRGIIDLFILQRCIEGRNVSLFTYGFLMLVTFKQIAIPINVLCIMVIILNFVF